MIKPTGYHILVEMEAVEETTESGIVIATAKEHKREQGGHDIAYVRAIGPTAHMGYEGCTADTPEGRAAQWGYKIDDKVQIERYQGKLLDVPGYENWRLVTDNTIMGVIE